MIHIVVILKESMHVINRSGIKVYHLFHNGSTNISPLLPIICKFLIFSGVMTIFWNNKGGQGPQHRRIKMSNRHGSKAKYRHLNANWPLLETLQKYQIKGAPPKDLDLKKNDLTEWSNSLKDTLSLSPITYAFLSHRNAKIYERWKTS